MLGKHNYEYSLQNIDHASSGIVVMIDVFTKLIM
jgi:hypothetical protein